jgi:hypothetical protein
MLKQHMNVLANNSLRMMLLPVAVSSRSKNESNKTPYSLNNYREKNNSREQPPLKESYLLSGEDGPENSLYPIKPKIANATPISAIMYISIMLPFV